MCGNLCKRLPGIYNVTWTFKNMHNFKLNKTTNGKIEDLLFCTFHPCTCVVQQTQFMQFVSYYRVIVTVSGVHYHQSITSKLADPLGSWDHCSMHHLSASCTSHGGYQLTVASCQFCAFSIII